MNNENTMLAQKREYNSELRLFYTQKSCFASTVADNVKLLYLKMSLLEELMMPQQPDYFPKPIRHYF